MALWTVDREFDQPIRHACLTASGGSYVAVFTLRLAPDLDDAAVRFVNAVEDPEVGHWALHIEEGVRAYVETRAAAGFPVGYLRVTLVEITLHPVDSQPYRFREAAVMAMTQAFEAVGVELS
ncbi:elongation factor G [Aquisphaera giovannonii]|uniref:Elongation factor G n=2 Tax=Aquisphaera giovannonii TaxID=406548 RepID=A0A5B9W4Y8_9BACT|nr:elongation factor G [Aquisphaera giovannonii]